MKDEGATGAGALVARDVAGVAATGTDGRLARRRLEARQQRRQQARLVQRLHLLQALDKNKH